jgi:hypothetical protein
MPGAVVPPLRISREDGKSWALDAVTRVARDPRITITDHPIESGTPVSDHAQRDPDRITVAATVTATPLEGRTWDQPTGRDRLDAALDFLAELAGERLTLEFPDGTFDSYMLTSWAHERTAQRAIKFALEFREVIIADAAVVQIPVTQPVETAAASLPDAVDVGEQAGSTPGGDAAARGSIAHGFLYGAAEEEV